MDKKYLHHLWSSRIKPIHTAYLIVPFVVASTVCVFSLRANNIGMAERREAVYKADQSGKDVEAALRDLREYVLRHMNTKLTSGASPVYPPIQLKYTYQRLVDAEQKRLSEAAGRIYTDAQEYCEKQYPDSFSGGPRVPCIQKYVSDNGVQPHKVPDSMYKFDFISPRWSPDLAGWSMIAAVVFGVLALLRLVAGVLARQFL